MTMEMVKNGVQFISLYGDYSAYSRGSQTIVIVLEVNDSVWMRHYRNHNSASIYDQNDQPVNIALVPYFFRSEDIILNTLTVKILN